MTHIKTLVLFGLFTCAACGGGEGEADRLRREALMEDARSVLATGAVGVQVSYDAPGSHVWVSDGLADLDAEAAITEGSRFRIASTTKTFVMALVLMLVEEGALSLDDTVDTWLPGLVDANENDGAQITVRHLLAHRGGLHNHVDDLFAALGEAGSAAEIDALLKKTWTPAELVALAVSHPRIDVPGETFAYSDTGYVLLGMIIEAVTGDRWQEALRSRVIVPLGLSGTSAPEDTLMIEGAHMRGYSELPFSDGLVDVTEISPSSLDAAASIISTPRDVNAFFRALLGGELFGAALMKEMKAVVGVGEEGVDLRYGLGLAWLPLPCGGGYYFHSGDTLGYHTRNGVSEDGAQSVCFAVTAGDEIDGPIGEAIARVLCASR